LGLGPTYLSKVIRFALPEEYGAIDTRIVRVVGQGDPASRQHNWLALRVRNDGYGWYIPKVQVTWPNDYAKWINILRFLQVNLITLTIRILAFTQQGSSKKDCAYQEFGRAPM